MQRVLVVGGAGYVGSHFCRQLAKEGAAVEVFDDLSAGYREFVRWGPLHVGDLEDAESIRRVIAAGRFDAVVHFASKVSLGESVRDPLAYYRTNVTGTLNLLSAMEACGVKTLLFSSSASVYGTPLAQPIRETQPLAPISPYGRTKVHAEQALADLAATGRLRYAALRYFNAAGAADDLSLGEAHEPETHLIPLAIAAALEQGPALTVLGNDYPTADGTCVRDYVNVEDLADAHIAALRYLGRGGGSLSCNVGSGVGTSVAEVIAAVERATGRHVPFTVGPRRPGDPAQLVAAIEVAESAFGWRPRRRDINAIVGSAARWHMKHGFGRRAAESAAAQELAVC